MTDSECCASEVFSMEDYGFYSDVASCCTDSTLEEAATIESPPPSPPPLARLAASFSKFCFFQRFDGAFFGHCQQILLPQF
ncbi:unnamed protein product [Anisakis simplex]|uniref:Uncharacterized protein n=1 Tax=Anisakis simplex TaxID=6269 RepID=A0A0M3KDS8_ANISI|nr:unnamed protein product [Anisakis simplex]